MNVVFPNTWTEFNLASTSMSVRMLYALFFYFVTHVLVFLKSSVAGLEVLSQIFPTGSASTKPVSSPCCVHLKVAFQFKVDLYLNDPKKVHEFLHYYLSILA